MYHLRLIPVAAACVVKKLRKLLVKLRKLLLKLRKLSVFNRMW